MPRTVTLVAASATTVTLVAGQTSVLTDAAGVALYADEFVDVFPSVFGEPITMYDKAVHKTTVTITEAG